jgi:hypothetical protein
MNKLLVVMLATAFPFVLGSALADDKTPAQPVDQAKPKADTDAAKANAKAMTPEEKAAAKEAKRAAEREKALSPWTVEGAHRLDRELSTNRQAEKDAAKAAAAKMTPEEKAAARKAKRAKRQQEASAIAKEADTGQIASQQKDEADAAAAKAQPKALPDARPRDGVPLDQRYRDLLPPGGPAQRDPAKSNP